MPRVGQKMSDEARAELSTKQKAIWAAKRAAAAMPQTQERVDEDVTTAHINASTLAIQKVKKQLEEEELKLDRQMRANASLEKSLTSRIKDLRDLYEQAEESLRQANKDLVEVKGEINSRILYREQQEKGIEDMVNKGNDQLYEVDQEVKELLRKRDSYNLEVADLQQQKITIENEISVLRESSSSADVKLESLRLRYEEMADRYRSDLVDTKNAIAEEKKNLNVVRNRVKEITEELISKKSDLTSREQLLDSRAEELASRERLLKSREKRYD